MSDFDDSYFKESTQVLLNEIADLNQDNILTFIDKRLPGWLIHCNQHYAPECKMFEENWRNKLCKIFRVEPKSILIVNKIVLPYGQNYKNHIVLMRYCDALTRYGYCVRSTDLFTECSKCKRIRQSNNNVNHMCIIDEELEE